MLSASEVKGLCSVIDEDGVQYQVNLGALPQPEAMSSMLSLWV